MLFVGFIVVDVSPVSIASTEAAWAFSGMPFEPDNLKLKLNYQHKIDMKGKDKLMHTTYEKVNQKWRLCVVIGRHERLHKNCVIDSYLQWSKEQHRWNPKRKINVEVILLFSTAFKLTRNTWLALSLNMLSSGESTGVCFVNFVSNWLTSSSLFREGLWGGSYRLL